MLSGNVVDYTQGGDDSTRRMAGLVGSGEARDKRRVANSPHRGAVKGGLSHGEQRRREAAAERARLLAERRVLSGSMAAKLTLAHVEANRISVEEPPPGKRKYQRPLRDDRVMDIALSFDWDQFTPVICAHVPKHFDRFYVLDGQHHWAAAQLVHGDTVVVPIQVVRADTYERRAQLFDLLNGERRAVGNVHRFGVRLTWGEEEAAAIGRTVEALGFTLRFDHATLKAGEIAATGALQRMYDLGGEQAIVEVLSILKDAWALHPDAYRASMIEGLFSFVWRYHGEYLRDRLLHVMRMRTAQKVYEDARKSPVGADKLRVAIGYTLHAYYNLDLRSTPRLGPFAVDKNENGLLVMLARRYKRQMRPAAPVTLGTLVPGANAEDAG